MPISDAILNHLPGLALVIARITGLFIFAPLLSSIAAPRQVKVVLVLGTALALYPAMAHQRLLPPDLQVMGLMMLAAGELLIGLSIGILAAVPLMTAQLAGIIMGQQMGLGLASVYNPTIDFEGDAIGQILFFVAMASYLVAGGLEAVYSALLSTFAHVPIGAFGLADAPLDLLVGVVHSGFDCAIRIAMPVLLILTLETVATGLIMKTVPSLNIMNVGFPVRILLGMVVIVASLAITLEVLMGSIDEDLELIAAWGAKPAAGD